MFIKLYLAEYVWHYNHRQLTLKQQVDKLLNLLYNHKHLENLVAQIETLPKTKLFFILTGIFLFISNLSYAQQTSATVKTITPYFSEAIVWNYGGESPPEVQWTPYLPLTPPQIALRFRLGARLSGLRFNIKDSVKVTFSYNPDEAKAGKVLKLKIKPEILDE
ncbi:MAG: hypothetical protein NC818_04080, partial [Candidatus Omnitrophica bacterium]|nr:hypothetical protein [Candidatus Omnitrophota bacterium]